MCDCGCVVVVYECPVWCGRGVWSDTLKNSPVYIQNVHTVLSSHTTPHTHHDTQQHSTEHACQCGKPCRSSQRTKRYPFLLVSMVEPNQRLHLFLLPFWTRNGNDVEQRTVCTSVSLRASTKLCPCQKVHHLSGPNTCALTQYTLKITVGVVCVWCCDVMVMCMMVMCVVCTNKYTYTYTHTHT